MAVIWIGEDHGRRCWRDDCPAEARYKMFTPEHDQLGLITGETIEAMLCQPHFKELDLPSPYNEVVDCPGGVCSPDHCDWPACKQGATGEEPRLRPERSPFAGLLGPAAVAAMQRSRNERRNAVLPPPVDVSQLGPDRGE